MSVLGRVIVSMRSSGTIFIFFRYRFGLKICECIKDTLSQVYFFGQILSVRPVQVLFQLSPATPHGCHDLRESVSRACGQQMREMRHPHSKVGVKKTSWSCAEPLEFAP